MKVRELMTADPVTLRPTDRIVDAEEQMGLRGFRHVPVVDDARRLVGMLSQVDVIRASLADGSDRIAVLRNKAAIKVEDVMSTRLDTVGPDADLADVARELRRKHRACLPVVDGDLLLGVVTEADFVRIAALALAPDAPWSGDLERAWHEGQATG